MAVMGMAAPLVWTSTAFSETQAEADVRGAMIEVVAAASRLDADGIMARLDPDPALRYYVQGQSFNYPDLAVFLRQSFADMTTQRVVWLESSARELAPDTVLWTSYGRNPVVEASGKEIEYILGETWVWKKTDGNWRAIHYHESFLEAPSREKRERVESALSEFAASLKIESRNPEPVMAVLNEFVRSHPEVVGSAFAFAPTEEGSWPAPYVHRKGSEIIRKTLPSDSGYERSDWYAVPAASGQPAWSEPYFDTHGAQTMMITYSIPITDTTGDLLGVLTADVAFY